jgi:hypothetical protein
VFFHCSGANAVWSKLSLEHVASLDDADIWNAQVPPGLASILWPFVLLTLLWRLWESRNGAIFPNEHPSPRTIVTRVCDDLLTRRKRLKADQATKLDAWRCCYLLSCNATSLVGSTPPPPRFVYLKKLHSSFLYHPNFKYFLIFFLEN